MHVGFQVIANGADVTARFQDRLVSLSVTDEVGQKSDRAEIVLDNRNGKLVIPEAGAALEIALGPKGQLVSLGRFVVDEVSGEIGPDLMTISAKAANMTDAMKARQTRAWKKVTVEDIVSKIAGQYDLSARVSDELAKVRFEYLAQTSESDIAFLSRLAHRLDATSKPAGKAFLFVKRGTGKSASGQELPSPTLYPTDISGGSWKLSSRGVHGTVTARWGDRASGHLKTITVGGNEPVKALRHPFSTESEAKAAASAELERGARAAGQLNLKLAGFHGEIAAGGNCVLSGFNEGLNGSWTVTRVVHDLQNSLTTTVHAERKKET